MGVLLRSGLDDLLNALHRHLGNICRLRAPKPVQPAFGSAGAAHFFKPFLLLVVEFVIASASSLEIDVVGASGIEIGGP